MCFDEKLMSMRLPCLLCASLAVGDVFAQSDVSMGAHEGYFESYSRIIKSSGVQYAFDELASNAVLKEGRDVSFTLDKPFESPCCANDSSAFVGFPLAFHLEEGDVYVLNITQPKHKRLRPLMRTYVFDGNGISGLTTDWFDHSGDQDETCEIGYAKSTADVYVGISGTMKESEDELQTSITVRTYPKIAKLLFEAPSGFRLDLTDANSAAACLSKLFVSAYDAAGYEIQIINDCDDQWEVDLKKRVARFTPAIYPVMRFTRAVSDENHSRLERKYVTPLVDEAVSLELNLDDLSTSSSKCIVPSRVRGVEGFYNLFGQRLKSPRGLHIVIENGRGRLCSN